jgi:hypothetical protein
MLNAAYKNHIKGYSQGSVRRTAEWGAFARFRPQHFLLVSYFILTTPAVSSCINFVSSFGALKGRSVVSQIRSNTFARFFARFQAANRLLSSAENESESAVMRRCFIASGRCG